MEKAFANNELIKVKFIDMKESRREISSEIAKKTESILVRVIGNIAVLYREFDEPDQREIHIPGV